MEEETMERSKTAEELLNNCIQRITNMTGIVVTPDTSLVREGILRCAEQVVLETGQPVKYGNVNEMTTLGILVTQLWEKYY